MSGPKPLGPLSPERHYAFDDFLALLGFRPDGSPIACDAYLVVVHDAGIWDGAARPPTRGPRDTLDQHKRRCEAAERAHQARARHEGVHLISHPVPPGLWNADDLELLMASAYRLLPSTEPRWRDAGAITQRVCPDHERNGKLTTQYCLEVARGDYIASIQLPGFPAIALAEWLADRPCEVLLHHPVLTLETLLRHMATEQVRVRQTDIYYRANESTRGVWVRNHSPIAPRRRKRSYALLASSTARRRTMTVNISLPDKVFRKVQKLASEQGLSVEEVLTSVVVGQAAA